MELRFIALALRRFWWVVAAFAVLGAAAASVVGGPAADEYESTALLLVRPSTNAVSPALSSQPDRYVLGQISVLESSAMAESVADALGDGENARSVARSVEFTQRDETDIVEVTARTNDPVRSQRIAQAYASRYLADTATRSAALFDPERARLTEELASVEIELARVNDTLADAAAPYLATLDNETPVPVPDIRVLNPSAATQQSLLLEEIQRLNAALNSVDLASREAVQSEIIQFAPVPDDPAGDATNLLRVAAIVLLTILGAIVAMVAGRASPTIIDEGDIVAHLGLPIEAHVPYVPALADAPERAVEQLSPGWRGELDQLANRVELASTVAGARIVAVGGSTIGAGSTTLAIGLASRFARRGSRTVLIDADTTQATLTSALHAPTRIHIADLAGERPDVLGATSLDNLITLGVGVGDAGRRIDGRAIASGLRNAADVVVIDVGPVLESVSASQLAAGIDQLVLAVPSRGQRHDGIEQVARAFGSYENKLLPVVVSTTRSLFNAPTRSVTRSESGGRIGPRVVEDAA